MFLLVIVKIFLAFISFENFAKAGRKSTYIVAYIDYMKGAGHCSKKCNILGYFPHYSNVEIRSRRLCFPHVNQILIFCPSHQVKPPHVKTHRARVIT